MSNFLKDWDKVVQEAKETGKPGVLVRQDHMLDQPRVVARTRHPSFMGEQPIKHDPNRDRS
mgnify:CR=1 FL=1